MTKYIILLLFSIPAMAVQDDKRQLMCVAKSQMAKATQEVRQLTHDDWVDFHRKAKQIYKIDAGLDELLHIADFVYHNVPDDLSPDDLYVKYIYSCVDQQLAISEEVVL